MALGQWGLALAGRLDRRRARTGVHAALADHRRYERQIDRLHQRHLFDGGLHRLTDGEINLATVVMHRTEVARLLARTVAAGGYRIRPAVMREIVVEGRRRTVFEFPLLDLIVHGVVADLLTDLALPRLSPSVYSYRAGTSWMAGVSALTAYLRRHRRERPDPRMRGLYVLRRDVDAYTDSIPLGARSAIWGQLDALLATGDSARGWLPPTDSDRRLIEEVVRPTVLSDDGAPATRLHGVATGQPIASVCFNLYLADLDRELGAVPGGFYARYSDDLVFCHPDADVARAASQRLDELMVSLRLRFNEAKRHDLYLTGAGRAAAQWPEARGTTSLSFLGMLVSHDGTVALGRRKTRGLLRDARRRAANTARAVGGQEEDVRGRAVSSVLRRLLDPDDPFLAGSAAPLLARVVTDRHQLDALDHQLAGIVATAVSGRAGPGAFRSVPYRRIRSEWGLRSVRRARDRGGTRRRN
ncbi:MAG TPA: hypothetical protein VJK49_00155 [Candidatus Limnocylindrales bacterium]|nr:hypothetical protein [Candidatus Limnocylindrales bacterium]